MNISTQRILVAYTILLAGIALFILRRMILPTTFEIQGVPFDIAVPSVLNSCYNRPALNTCSDSVIVTLTTVGVVLASGWRSAGRMIFAVILGILPLGLYFVLSPIWIPLILLALLPLEIEIGTRFLFPKQERRSI
ncbi:hypothetical protein EYB53_007495 [Candidatus Chloroploca sp. M-50]|uniref:Uncharacterized protein n=1 Tax=Candidatus Chloroploca mongolica TaxID=2528176 RepID=A0ABS4D7Z7_9CHLR|nr:hypothetical protein [Candidatus Chloroploca mongolica]MBP1465547.1 hypothetical protein [Candidatus Chloroploca mongolica]